MDLPQLKTSLQECQRCQLSKGRTQVVFGNGKPTSFHHVRRRSTRILRRSRRRPVCGSGRKITHGTYCNQSDLNDPIFISPMLSNADHRTIEIRCPMKLPPASPFSCNRLNSFSQKLVCTLGNFATQTLLERKVGITKVRGQVIRLEHFIVFPLFHPAAALHQGNLRIPLKEDFQKLKSVLEKMSQPPTLPNASAPPTLSTAKESSQETTAEPPTQMSLF